MDFSKFPSPPAQMPQQQYYQQSYESQGKPPVVETQKPIDLGFSFDGLISDNATPAVVVSSTGIVKDTPSKSGRKKKESNSTDVAVRDENGRVSSKDIVETTIYGEAYQDTNAIAYGVIQQADILMNDAKQEFDSVRVSRNLKGRNLYLNNLIQSMNGLMSTKIQAIREINNTTKNAMDAEYRRYKDNKAFDSADDNKAVMDAYQAFISAPIGAPTYRLPNTQEITSGSNGVIITELPGEEQARMDQGMTNYINNLSPEQHLMLLDNNPDVEEVVVFDQATGAKYFQWMNMRTKEPIPNMPISSTITIEDYTIDPLTRLAKNVNINDIKKVIYINEGRFDNF